MTDKHSITPPPELVRHWSRFQGDTNPETLWFRIATKAAQWGYEQRGEVNEAKLQQARDEELEALCEWLNNLPSPDLLIRSSLRSHHGEEGTQTPPTHRRTNDD